MINIAIFASGSGSNAQRIAEFFSNDARVNISRIYTNNPSAYVLERADKLKIPTLVFSRADFSEGGIVAKTLQNDHTHWIVLAGFLWLVPAFLIKQFAHRIINIHPALLPDYGGKGMYGARVHQAVIANHESESGITIHYVNENYDEGQIIFQARCEITADDTAETLASKIHALEYKHFPVVIKELLEGGH